MKNVRWVPDIILLMVVFTGIFSNLRTAVLIWITAGFFRSCFSINPFWLDIFVFLTLGQIIFTLSNMLNRYNPIAQMFLTTTGVLWVFSFQMFFLGMINNNVKIFAALLSQWNPFVMTVLISPLWFFVSRRVLKMDEL
ncbi:MAG: hypothetical protein ABH844_07600 [Candidatus Omnitrophota bacterium]